MTRRDIYPKPKIGTLSAAETKQLLDSGQDILVVDLRDSDDRKTAGWIKDSVHIDVEELEQKYHQIPSNRKVLLSCLHGKQGYMAARFLVSKGYNPDMIFKLDGGMIDGWIKGGHPVEK